jgi:uracil-DNA glycosylase family 4
MKPVSRADLPRELADVHHAIVSCERCPRLREYCRRVALKKKRAYRHETYWGRPVPGFGDPAARLLIVGLAPAAHGANRTGRVFTGDGTGGSGDFLMAALHRTGFASLPTSTHRRDGLALRDAYILAAVRCAPPDNKPLPEEITRCLDHLDAEVDALRHVQVVVALGRIGFDAWLQVAKRRGVRMSRPKPQFAHGSVARMDVGKSGLPGVLIGCYHPSRQNTNTGVLTARMMRDVFLKARAMLDSNSAGPMTPAESQSKAHAPQ